MDIASISALVAAIGVIVGLIFTVLQLRDFVKTRQTDMVMRLYSHSGSKEYVEAMHKIVSAEYKDYDDFVKRYGSILSEDPTAIALGMVVSFNEGIGILLHRKLVDVDLIRELFPVETVWRLLKSLIDGVRKEYNFPYFCEWFEYLYNEMKKREQRLHAQHLHHSLSFRS